ncbi:helix-turn-helix DNA binding domain protein [Gordonia phage BBQValindra]|nr:helix-turn-helix DNA binding domain protein [Gordonia phage BBQValindra]
MRQNNPDTAALLPTRRSSIAATVRAEISRADARQAVVAEHLQISQSALSKRLKGTVRFTAEELVSIAELLGIPPAVLLGDDRASA